MNDNGPVTSSGLRKSFSKMHAKREGIWKGK